tara:strand:- start:1683 stop:2477 length:795 start_codon:yes stop_codon:yes gene_type:complete
MLIHAKQYGRNTFQHVEQLRSEIFNLNNVIIILLPDWSVISRRFTERGDAIQNLSSLKKVYDLFSDASEELKEYPNVIVLRDEVDRQTVRYLTNILKNYENATTECIKDNVLQACVSRDSGECVGLNFTLFDDGTFDDIDEADLLYDKEVEYYNEILEKVKEKIKLEFEGKNEYNLPQDKNSRRFIYTSDTCISLAHFLLRDESLDCKYFIRSSNVKDTLYYDLNFLKFLSSSVFNALKASGKFCRMTFVINSGHVLDIINNEP